MKEAHKCKSNFYLCQRVLLDKAPTISINKIKIAGVKMAEAHLEPSQTSKMELLAKIDMAESR